MNAFFAIATALTLMACAEKQPVEEQPEEIKYDNAYPARLNLPVLRDDFGTMDLVWADGDKAVLLDESGKTVGKLEILSGEGSASAIFQIWTDLTEGTVRARFGGADCRVCPGFIAESDFFQISPRLTTLDLSIPVALVKARISAAKGTKMFGTEFNSLEISGDGVSFRYEPEKPALIRENPGIMLFAIPAADLSGKTLKCKVKTFYGTDEISGQGQDFRAGEINALRILASADGWEIFNPGAAPETYVYSSEIKDSESYNVRIGGALQKVYPSKDFDVCAFGTDAPVTVEINSATDIESFSVRPLNKGYKAVQLDSRTIAFEIEPYGRASVELNGSIDTPLFVFANPVSSVFEKQVEGMSNVRRVKAGEILRSSVFLKSGQALFVEGGGVLMGKAGTGEATGAKIVGGGIIDSWEDFSEVFGVRVMNSKDVTVAGITIICNTGRAFFTTNSEGLTYDGVKVLGTSAPSSDNRQTDAMDLYGARRAKITHCFCFSNDDTYCIKTWKWSYKAETNYVEFEDCISWNYRGNGFEIGYETGLDVHDISYKDIYSIRSSCGRAAASFRRGAVSIHGAAAGTISNVTYDGVYIEDPWEGGIDMRILKSSYELGTGEVWGPGIITGVKMKNVKMEKMPVEGQNLLGYNATHRISLEIENLEIAGKRITTASEGKFHLNSYVDLSIK